MCYIFLLFELLFCLIYVTLYTIHYIKVAINNHMTNTNTINLQNTKISNITGQDIK